MESTSPQNQGGNPRIEFGLYYAGDMAGYLKFDIPYDNYPPHDYGLMRDHIDTEVAGFICSIHNKYRRTGYFTAPFFVRCALRGHDGRNLYVSPPQLMTAGLLPPCLDHYSFPEYDRLAMHFTLRGCPCFRLMIRLGDLPQAWAAKIKSADIYVSRQIQVWRCGGGHRCEYTDVLRSIRDQSIHDRFDAGEFVLMLKGRYCKSEFSPIFDPHYNDAAFAKTPVWYVSPNNDLEEMLAAEKEFYNIASIDACDIIGHKSFQTVAIRSTMGILFDYLDTLDESTQTGGNLSRADAVTPTVETRHDVACWKSHPLSVPGYIPVGSLLAKARETHGYLPASTIFSISILFSISIFPVFASGLSPPEIIPSGIPSS